MVSMPALIAALQPLDGRDPTTLNNIGRALRPDFIVTSKRGGGAADMDFKSAVNLILAFYGADAARDAPAAVEVFRQLHGYQSAGDDRLDVFAKISGAERFGNALEILIEGLPEILTAIWNYILAAEFPGDPRERFEEVIKGEGPAWVNVELRRYGADIACFETGHNGAQRPVFSKRFYADPDTQRRIYKLGLREGTDKRVTIEFGLPTLIAAWGAVTSSGRLQDPETYINAYEEVHVARDRKGATLGEILGPTLGEIVSGKDE